MAGHDVQPSQIRRARLGLTREGCGGKIHHDHVAASRRLFDVLDRRDEIQHRGLDAVQARSIEGARGRVSPPGTEAVLLLLATRLASSGLLAARQDGIENWTPRRRELGALPRL